jgi:hypothetical protein
VTKLAQLRKRLVTRETIQFTLTALMLLGATTSLYLYSKGYRLQKKTEQQTINLKMTGMVNIKSYPEGANVYLNGVLITATNNTISGIEPGKHFLKIAKNGYITWTKEIDVFPELATDITALLISQTPRLEPLTNTGAKNPSISPTATSLAFFSQDGENPGVWVVPLTDKAVNLFRSNPYVVLLDDRVAKYSNGLSIEWAPDERSLLIQTDMGKYYLQNLDTKSLVTVSNPDTIRKDWAEKTEKKRRLFIEKLDIPEELKEQAVNPNTKWAPDEKKFLYSVIKDGQIEYHVYNSEKPLPVGEKVSNTALTLKENEPQPKITWYPDSFHLILTEGDVATNKKGTISIVRIDGTNKTEIYNNTLFSDQVYAAPSGDKLIILTSYKSTELTDLYTVGLR